MIKHKKHLGWLVIGLLAAANLVCTLPVALPKPPGGATPTANSSSSGLTPQAGGTAKPVVPESALNVAAGQLDNLKSYQASLTFTAHGTKDGQTFQESYEITQTLSSSPDLIVVAAHSSGLGQGPDYSGTVLIQSGPDFFARASSSGPCRQEPSAAATGLTGALFSLLPDLSGGVKDASSEQAGQPADHYNLAGGSVSGDLWIAAQGGFLLQASLKQDGSLDILGPGVTGHADWQYSLQEINQPVKVDLPKSCQNLLGAVPIPPGAANLTATDTTVQFTTTDVSNTVLSFYSDAIAKNGWKLVKQPPDPSAPPGLAYYNNQNQLTSVTAHQDGNTLDVAVSIVAPQAAGSPANPTPSGPADVVRLISASLGNTLGTGKGAPVLPSYHLEAKGVDPSWNSAAGKVDLTTYTLAGDANGKDVHFLYAASVNNGPSKTTDVYTVGGQNYQVVNGKTQPANPLDALAWVTWSLGPTSALAVASNGAASPGQESVAGRPADKYALDSASVRPDVLKTLQGITNISAAKGTVWIDQATGALLQADLSYTLTVVDPTKGSPLGTGQGSFQWQLSNIGGASVKLP